jgi:hypothetical protein
MGWENLLELPLHDFHQIFFFVGFEDEKLEFHEVLCLSLHVAEEVQSIGYAYFDESLAVYVEELNYVLKFFLVFVQQIFQFVHHQNNVVVFSQLFDLFLETHVEEIQIGTGTLLIDGTSLEDLFDDLRQKVVAIVVVHGVEG